MYLGGFDMTQPKPTPKEIAAAKEIRALCNPTCIGYTWPEYQDKIAAIIHKHKTPAEKAAPKLLEVLKEGVRRGIFDQRWKDMAERIIAEIKEGS